MTTSADLSGQFEAGANGWIHFVGGMVRGWAVAVLALHACEMGASLLATASGWQPVAHGMAGQAGGGGGWAAAISARYRTFPTRIATGSG